MFPYGHSCWRCSYASVTAFPPPGSRAQAWTPRHIHFAFSLANQWWWHVSSCWLCHSGSFRDFGLFWHPDCSIIVPSPPEAWNVFRHHCDAFWAACGEALRFSYGFALHFCLLSDSTLSLPGFCESSDGWSIGGLHKHQGWPYREKSGKTKHHFSLAYEILM